MPSLGLRVRRGWSWVPRGFKRRAGVPREAQKAWAELLLGLREAAGAPNSQKRQQSAPRPEGWDLRE